MLYFDTSFLIPLVVEEATSIQVERFVQSLTQELAVSHWTRAEITSALAREVRMGKLDKESALAADAQLEAVLLKSFTTLAPTVDDFQLCKQYLSQYEVGLRAGDALHLAIASRHQATAIYTLDRSLVKAGQHLRLPVKTGIHIARASP